MHNIGKRTILAATCTKCGELKQGSEYYRKSAGYRTGTLCRPCSQGWVGSYNREQNQQSDLTALKKYQPWSGEDVKKLLEWTGRLTDREIAKRLGRTMYSLTAMRHRLRQMNDEFCNVVQDWNGTPVSCLLEVHGATVAHKGLWIDPRGLVDDEIVTWRWKRERVEDSQRTSSEV